MNNMLYSEHEIVSCDRLLSENAVRDNFGSSVAYIDNTMLQWTEFFRVQNPKLKPNSIAFNFELNNFLSENRLPTIGNWIFYPWINTVVRVLPKSEFRKVRYSRNKNKITDLEQSDLLNKSVGIIGLSVGQTVGITMAMEGSFGKVKIADYDVLDLSNMNRLRAGIHQIGLPKTTLLARTIVEMDPYTEIEIFSEGISDHNLDFFLSGLDLLVEESDSFEIKIKSRKKAREKGIPVIMDTSDRGMLDIERFDLEPDRPLFHGRVKELESLDLSTIDPQVRMQILMQLVDYPNFSTRLKESYALVGTELVTWPQLASDVMAGGGHAAEAARKILLGMPMASGRYYVELDKVRD